MRLGSDPARTALLTYVIDRLIIDHRSSSIEHRASRAVLGARLALGLKDVKLASFMLLSTDDMKLDLG